MLKDGKEVFVLQLGIVQEDFGLGHSCGEPSERVPDGDAQTSDARRA